MAELALNPTPDGGAAEGGKPRWLAPAVITVLLVCGAGWLFSTLGDSPAPPRRQTVKIAVLPDTPPPPPPPKEEKRPEPDKQTQQAEPVPMQQPKPMEAPPEPQQLKMDGPAGDGPSAFAAGAVSQDYKGGAIGNGPGGGNRMQFAFFTNRLLRHIQTELARRAELKGSDYRVNVRVWLADDGQLHRIELASSSGDPQTDRLLQEALTRLPAIDQVPSNLPQPLSMRITNRVTG